MHLKKHLSVIIASFLCLICVNVAQSAESFIIDDIKVEGLQRISKGTFFTYLPVRVGERIDDQKAANIVRSLFKQGDFEDVQLGRENNVLVIFVKERPTINSITFVGNKKIESDELKSGLRSIGLAQGLVLNRSVLNKVKQDLENQYYSQGRYGVDVNLNVKPLPRNRVDIEIEINEGQVVKIKQINIIGNEMFDDETLIDRFDLGESHWLSFYTGNDQYSKQKLAGDLEILRSYYLDRGFLKFSIDSTQVSISPDKKELFITINVTEGARYHISTINLAGELIVDEQTLRAGIAEFINPNDLFSRRAITNATEFIGSELGNRGYVFANINPVPTVNEEEKTVDLTFFVDPGKRIYLRRIQFSGNTKTDDEVLRREMRQYEGTWVSTGKVERSKTRLERTGFFSNVKVETTPVLGAPDLVDVKYTVVEQPSGNLTAGVGFSRAEGLIVNFGVSQDNFLGTGNRVNLNFNNSEANRLYNVSVFDPYLTNDGISGSARVFYREFDAKENRKTDFTRDTYGGFLGIGLPISEDNSVRVGFDFNGSNLKARGNNVSEQVRDFYADNGQNIDLDDSIKLDNYALTLGFTHDTRNSGFLPTKGMLNTVNAEVSIPGSDVLFYKLSYKGHWYHSLNRYSKLLDSWTFLLRGEVAYGNTYGKSEVFPFYENFFAGGMSSLRGFEENGIGPKEVFVNRNVNPNRVILDDPIGGNLRILGGFDVMFPMPFMEENTSMRPSLFLDVGNVIDTEFNFDDSGLVGDDVPDFDDLSAFRASVGVSLTWITQLGPLSFSLGYPIMKEDDDDVQVIQFSFGSTF